MVPLCENVSLMERGMVMRRLVEVNKHMPHADPTWTKRQKLKMKYFVNAVIQSILSNIPLDFKVLPCMPTCLY